MNKAGECKVYEYKAYECRDVAQDVINERYNKMMNDPGVVKIYNKIVEECMNAAKDGKMNYTYSHRTLSGKSIIDDVLVKLRTEGGFGVSCGQSSEQFTMPICVSW